MSKRGKNLAAQLNARAASPEGQKRKDAMKQCERPHCRAWYSKDNEKAAAYHEEGRC